MRRTWFTSGDWNVICDRCGFKFKATEVKQEPRTGLMVCDRCWESWHPQELIRPLPEQQKLPFTRSEATDTFISHPNRNSFSVVSSAYPVQIYRDDFERPNEHPISSTGNWTRQAIAPGNFWSDAWLENGAIIGDAVGGILYWNANTPEADQWASWIPTTAFVHQGVVLRLIPDQGTCYLIVSTSNSSISLYRWNNLSVTGLGFVNAAFALNRNMVLDSDVIMADVVTVDANTVKLSVYINGRCVYVLHDTDPNRLTAAGRVGCMARDIGGVASWSAGNIASGSQGFLVLGARDVTTGFGEIAPYAVTPQAPVFNTRAASGTTPAFTVPPYCDAVVAIWQDSAGADDGNVMGTLSLSTDGSLLPAKHEDPRDPIISNAGIAVKRAPTAGQQTLSWAYSNNETKFDAALSLLFLRGLDTLNPYRSSNIAQSSGGANCEVSVNSVRDDYVLGLLINASAGAQSISGTPIQVMADPLGNGRFVSSSVQTALDVPTTTITMTGENFPVLGAVSLKPAILSAYRKVTITNSSITPSSHILITGMVPNDPYITFGAINCGEGLATVEILVNPQQDVTVYYAVV